MIPKYYYLILLIFKAATKGCLFSYMEYFIVINEWSYPVESGREIVEDFDNIEPAIYQAKSECAIELETFEKVCNGHCEVRRMVDNYGNTTGFILRKDDFFFRSVIVKREI